MNAKCVYHLPGLGEVIMLPSVDPLAALGELERRYNGPVPEALRRRYAAAIAALAVRADRAACAVMARRRQWRQRRR